MGNDPSVGLQTSPGHLQAWIHLSRAPLEPAVAAAATSRETVVVQPPPGVNFDDSL